MLNFTCPSVPIESAVDAVARATGRSSLVGSRSDAVEARKSRAVLVVSGVLPALFLGATAWLASPAQAQTRIFRELGQGDAVAGIGDIDGDGHADFACGKNWVVTVYSGLTGVAQFSTTLTSQSWSGVDSYPTAVSALGDLTGDGRPEFLVADSQYSLFGTVSGAVFVHSGANGAELHAFKAWKAGMHLGSSIDSVGDVDGDGLADFVAGAMFDSIGVPVGAGSVSLFSGGSKQTLLTIPGEDPFGSAGYAVAGTGDLDGDGVPDFIYSSPTGAAGAAAFLSVRSAANGAELCRISGISELGFALAGTGDVDLDGVPDFAAADLGYSAAWPHQGAVRVYSGTGCTQLYLFEGTGPNDGFGTDVDGGEDLDQDGVPDIIAGAPTVYGNWQTQNPGYLRAFSGATGRLLFQTNADTPHNEVYAHDVALLGDTNGDGVSEIGVATIGYFGAFNTPARTDVYSGVPLSFSASSHVISASNGGSIALRLLPGALHAGALYLIVGSGTGIAPPIPVDSVLVPLALDTYTLWSASHPNLPPLTKTLGVIDASGTALAEISAGQWSLSGAVGLQFFHAYVLLENGTVSFASNPLPLHIAP